MAVKIVIDHLSGSRAGTRQEFDLLPKIRFGRHPDNEIAFDAHKDLDASTRHAELRQEEGGAYVLYDVGSSNGTFFGGEKITRHPIQAGAPVEIEFGEGGPRLQIFLGDPAQMAAPLPMTMVGSRKKEPPSTMVGGQPPQPGRGAKAEIGPDGEKKPLTMSIMVSRAREHAKSAPKEGGFSKTSVFMKTMVDQALHQSSRRFKVMLIGLCSVFVLAVGGLVFWNLNLARTSKAMQDDNNEGGPKIVRDNHDAVYLFAYVDEKGDEKPFCTGFAVSAHYLATNAHCVEFFEKLSGKKQKVFAVRNGDAKARYDIKSASGHPGYDTKKQSIDVGLFELEGDPLPHLVRLASPKRIQNMSTGQNMFTYGFPGKLAMPSNPEATLTAGTIGRMTDTDFQGKGFDKNVIVQHSAFTMEGTSGSPIFDREGYVIAVNAGAHLFERTKKVVDKTTNTSSDVAMKDLLSGYAIGIRVDKLWEMLEDKGVAPKASNQ